MCKTRRRRILELSDDRECGKFRLAAIKPTRPLHATALLNLKFYRAIGAGGRHEQTAPVKSGMCRQIALRTVAYTMRGTPPC